MTVQMTFDFVERVQIVPSIIEMIRVYRKREDERIMEWSARAIPFRKEIVSAFLNAGGSIWCEHGEVRASLNGLTSREPNRSPDDHHNFLPVLRWVEIYLGKPETHK
ncbi:hypothetical protein EGJ57_04695 [Brucella anthropi]|uniref:hypothetical protein n=1 Tax=Brucella anthropi TaxID=529 RepID=UPI000F67AE95|nr:hypothetical protein [Brucella anthropi]RRY22070.1 hypothetical protein EGJ57_04695 [Brucella anthropi]